MKIKFEHDYQQKIMTQTFEEPTTIATADDVLAWRTEWLKALSTWHSPYKALIDCSNLTVASDSQELKDAFERMMKFLNGFFLRKAVGFGFDAAKHHDVLPFPVEKTEDDGAKAVGLRGARRAVEPGDFRAQIQLENHFRQHVMELSFANPVIMAEKAHVDALKSKITNNLMQWHSKWSLLVDCTNLDVDPAIHDEFAKMERFFRGFFLKAVLGYSPRGAKETYPFQVYRARHNAAGRLESEGTFSGDEADCRSRK